MKFLYDEKLDHVPFSTIDLEFFGSSIELITEWLSSYFCDVLEIQAQSCQIKLPSLGNVNPISSLLIFLNSSLLKIAKSTSPLIKSSLPFFFPKSLIFYF